MIGLVEMQKYVQTHSTHSTYSTHSIHSTHSTHSKWLPLKTSNEVKCPGKYTRHRDDSGTLNA
jgi:hypothetical protein